MRVLLGLVCLLVGTLTARHEAVSDLSWMTGCWVEDLGAVTIVDEWGAPSGRTMLGVSRILRGDSTVAVERRSVSGTGPSLTMTTVTTAMTGAGIVWHDAVRFSRDGAHGLELDRERRIGDHVRKLDELFKRTACTEASSAAPAETLQ